MKHREYYFYINFLWYFDFGVTLNSGKSAASTSTASKSTASAIPRNSTAPATATESNSTAPATPSNSTAPVTASNSTAPRRRVVQTHLPRRVTRVPLATPSASAHRQRRVDKCSGGAVSHNFIYGDWRILRHQSDSNISSNYYNLIGPNQFCFGGPFVLCVVLIGPDWSAGHIDV